MKCSFMLRAFPSEQKKCEMNSAAVRCDVRGYAVLGKYMEEEELCELGRGDGVVHGDE